MKKQIVFFSLFLLLCSFGDLQSSTFSAYNGMSGAKYFAITPTFDYSFNSSELNLEPILNYGFSDSFDLYVNPFSISFSSDFAYAGSWIMPRFGLTESHVIGIEFGFLYECSKLDYYITPQYHIILEGNIFDFEFNVGVEIPVENFSSSSIFSIIGPVVKVAPDIFHIFLEIDPYFVFGSEGGFRLDIAPGFYFGISEEISLSTAFLIRDLTEKEPNLGIGLWVSFGF